MLLIIKCLTCDIKLNIKHVTFNAIIYYLHINKDVVTIIHIIKHVHTSGYPLENILSLLRGNVHKTEPVVAHDEKSKFFIFFPEIAYGKSRNVV